MAKKNKLKGLPNNLIQQYFSTLFYFEKGYMADWIWNAAYDRNISDIQIDIIKETIIPKDLQIQPLTVGLIRLRETIKKELKNNNFTEDFIEKAYIEIYISPELKNQKIFGVLVTLEDKEGKVYRSKPYTQMVYGKYFEVFKPTLLLTLRKSSKNPIIGYGKGYT